MSSTENVDTQALVKEVMKLNNLSIKDVEKITGLNYKTLESKLYDKGRGFFWHELLLIRNALSFAKGVLTREINREANRPLSKARAWGLANQKSEKTTYVGDVLQRHRTSRKYNYRGELFTIREIASISGRSYAVCYQRLQKHGLLDSNDDITAVIDEQVKRGRRKIPPSDI